MDRESCETCDAKEFVRCVNVGLLCVQEHPWDRSTLSNIVFMLGSETASLLTPKQQDLQRADPFLARVLLLVKQIHTSS